RFSPPPPPPTGTFFFFSSSSSLSLSLSESSLSLALLLLYNPLFKPEKGRNKKVKKKKKKVKKKVSTPACHDSCLQGAVGLELSRSIMTHPSLLPSLSFPLFSRVQSGS